MWDRPRGCVYASNASLDGKSLVHFFSVFFFDIMLPHITAASVHKRERLAQNYSRATFRYRVDQAQSDQKAKNILPIIIEAFENIYQITFLFAKKHKVKHKLNDCTLCLEV